MCHINYEPLAYNETVEICRTPIVKVRSSWVTVENLNNFEKIIFLSIYVEFEIAWLLQLF